MDSVNDPDIETVVVMTSAQIGKTESLNNTVAYFIDQDPSPMLLVQPTLDMAEAWSKDRLAPMVRDTPAIKGKIKDARSRDSGNTLLHKQFTGGHITMAGANSPASLASRPVRVVLCDEVDRFPASAAAEGDPVNLARKRANNFWNRKIILTSTPTVEGSSRISTAYEQSDKRKYWVPCPLCKTYQVLVWQQVKFEPQQQRLAWYECLHCKGRIESGHKAQMLRLGEWRAEKPGGNVAGFHISELYSPWRSFGDVADDFIKAKDNPETLRVWVNTSLGETWKQKTEKPPSYEELMERREQQPFRHVPEFVQLLTAGVDVQQDRLIYSVYGWGAGFESALIEHGEVPDFDELGAALWGGEFFRPETGESFDVVLTNVDSGYRTDEVYEFVALNNGKRRVRAVKGQQHLSALFTAAKVETSGRSGKKRKYGLTLWHLDVSRLKAQVYWSLNREPGIPGCMHIPQDATEQWAKELTAEHQVLKRDKTGNYVSEWQLINANAPNHSLDTACYARAAAHMLNVNRFKSETKKPEVEEKPEETEESPVKKSPPAIKRPPQRTTWATGWRR